MITRSNIIVKQVVAPTWCSFEFSEWILIDGSFRLRLAVVYRPPYSTKHPVTISSFVSEFSQCLESFVLCTEPILLCGDFNIHVDVEDNPDAESFVDLIDSFGLAQHVRFARTYTGFSHNQENGQYHSKRTNFRLFSIRPATVLFNLNGFKSQSSAKETWFRKIKSINLPKFKNDLRNSELLPNTPKRLAHPVDCFGTTLKSIIEKHVAEIKFYLNDLEEILNQIQNSKFTLFAYGPIRSFRFNVIRGIST